jgi:hypothetical protein
MEGTCYSIKPDQDQWVVLACGTPVLICKRKKVAVMIARRAANMLFNDPHERRDACGPDTRENDCKSGAIKWHLLKEA